MTLQKELVERWMQNYLSAWKSNDAKQIAALFTEDAKYFTGPFDAPWVGRQAILDGWLAIGDQPGDWTFEYEVLAADGDLGVIHGTTVYKGGGTFSNIWTIRLTADGKCSEFREWFVRKRED